MPPIANGHTPVERRACVLVRAVLPVEAHPMHAEWRLSNGLYDATPPWRRALRLSKDLWVR